jgi:hypothetical protein
MMVWAEDNMMDQKTLWHVYRSLPDEAQSQLTDFIAFLRAKYRVAPPPLSAAMIHSLVSGMIGVI